MWKKVVCAHAVLCSLTSHVISPLQGTCAIIHTHTHTHTHSHTHRELHSIVSADVNIMALTAIVIKTLKSAVIKTFSMRNPIVISRSQHKPNSRISLAKFELNRKEPCMAGARVIGYKSVHRLYYHYTKIIVVRACVRAYRRKFTGSQSTPAQKSLFLCKAEVWRRNSWLTDTASNGISSRLNRGF